MLKYLRCALGIQLDIFVDIQKTYIMNTRVFFIITQEFNQPKTRFRDTKNGGISQSIREVTMNELPSIWVNC